MRRSAILAAFLVTACSQGTDPVLNDVTGNPDTAVPADVEPGTDMITLPDSGDTQPDGLSDRFVLDFLQETDPEIPFPTCEPGAGCFLDTCTENGQCLSGWCVEHMGDGVCTMLCQEECPDGWNCKTVGSGPDVVSICVSAHANLCKPCAAGADCKSPGGAEDVCLDYGHEGAFCGGICQEDKDCPWGFSCKEGQTVGGASVMQCVSDTGSCPCTGKSATLALSTPCAESNEHGTCTGNRTCTPEGLSACDAAVPQPETCNGLDDNCDGDIDEPAETGGDYINLCDDDNECSLDICLGEDGCQYEILNEGECKDGDTCTVGDHCQNGQCVGNPVICDDDNPCTDDSCDGTGGCIFVDNSNDCDDDNPCTVADECDQGQCFGTPVSCDCQSDDDCLPLEDNNLCNGVLYCDQTKLPYLCAVQTDTVVACPEPEGPTAVCLAPSCDPENGECGFVPAHDGFLCDDADLCTAQSTCLEGQCVPGPAVNCNDGNPCTDDLCKPDSGCVYQANTAPCNDGNACTTSDVCDQTQCIGTNLQSCDDSDACNGVETCNPQTGCVAGTPLICDDQNACNGQESCDPAAGCLPGEPLVCDDNNACDGKETCDPDKGCVPGQPLDCEDGDACNGKESCSPDIGCVPGKPPGCDDSNPCTDDSCDGNLGCINTPNQAVCNDQNLCTIGDKCADGKCTYESLQECDDGNPCTTTSCDPLQGCVSNLNSAPCDDDDLCTTGDHCHLGGCIASGELPCDDNNPCTNDSCNPDTGCQFLPNQAQCDDGNECTTGDICKNGNCSFTGFASCDDGQYCNGVEVCYPDDGCVAGPPPSLDDQNLCTLDSCDESQDAVLHIPDNELCNDHKFCNGLETCDLVAGCLQGAPPVLDDLVLCTIDQCDEEGDVVLHIPNDSVCVDVNVCNGLEYCNTVAGCASGPPLDCDDQVACTQDSCDPQAGCANLPQDTACDDSNSCTQDSCHSDNGCQNVPVADTTPCTTGGGLSGKCEGGVCKPDCQPGTQTFNYTGSETVFTLPECATLATIEAWGAEGGDEEVGKGGKGAYIKGTFDNLAGKAVAVHVGEQGKKGTCGICGGGGGGGSFVWLQSGQVPLLIAGGGGGASYQGNAGQPGLTTEQGGPGGYSSVPVGSGGYTDNGGGGGCGCGGGGWNGDGKGNSWCTGGKAKGGPGGVSQYMGHGGWSSGGAAFHGGGGGGGYSGGSGGTYPTGAGGGGSYNAGIEKTGQAGVNSGNGKVIISW